jgi:hypothetical protein
MESNHTQITGLYCNELVNNKQEAVTDQIHKLNNQLDMFHTQTVDAARNSPFYDKNICTNLIMTLFNEDIPAENKTLINCHVMKGLLQMMRTLGFEFQDIIKSTGL